MPLYKTISVRAGARIIIWQITETFEDLFDEVMLTDVSLTRLNTMKSGMQQRGFLSVRKLLQEAGYTDFDMSYDVSGKPHLSDGKHISITHSFEYAAIIVSDVIAGIDIEKQRDKIIRIADKFVDYEFKYLNPNKQHDYIRMLTAIWGAKESIFKIRNEVGISFKDHIKVNSFDVLDGYCRAWLHFGDVIVDFNICYFEVEDFMLVYAFENI